VGIITSAAAIDKAAPADDPAAPSNTQSIVSSSIPLTASNPRMVLVLGAVLVILAPMAVYARLGTVLLLIIALGAQPNMAGIVTALRSISQNITVRIGAALALWAAVTLLWTPNPNPVTVLRVIMVPALGLLLVRALRDLPAPGADLVARWTMIGGVAMAALMAMEVWSGGLILAWTHPDELTAPPDVWNIPIYATLARGAAILAPLLFAYALLIYARTRSFLLSLGFAAVVFAVCFSTNMDAAWVSLLGGAVVFVVALVAPRFALVGLFGSLILYTALAPVISAHFLTLDGVTDLGRAPWRGMEQRIGIWHHVAGLVAERPILGYGFDAARALSLDKALVPGTNWPALPLHTHNAIMQIWLELGAAGIGLVIAMLAMTARALWPMTTQPLHLATTAATIATTTIIALISFGIWQYWWLATWFLVAAVLMIALRTAPPRSGFNTSGPG